MPYFIFCHGCLKLLETNMWKKPHHLIGQLQILPCNLISQHAIFHEVSLMLTSDPLFSSLLVHEVIVYGLYEIILHGIWLKILNEATTDVNRNFTPSCIIFSKLFPPTVKEKDSHANFA